MVRYEGGTSDEEGDVNVEKDASVASELSTVAAGDDAALSTTAPASAPGAAAAATHGPMRARGAWPPPTGAQGRGASSEKTGDVNGL